LQGKWRPVLLTAIFAGLRASELRGLRWPNVDIEKCEIHVRERADEYNVLGRPKSGSGERTIPVPPIVVNTLRAWKLQCPKSKLDLVFPSPVDAGIVGLQYIVRRGLWASQIAAEVYVEILDADGKVVGRYAHTRTPVSQFLPVALLKLLVHPMLVAFVGKMGQALGVEISDFEISVLTLTAALPSASNVWALAERYGADHGRIARIILASTLLSFLTLSGAAWLLLDR
jgi:hypothetical protein